MIILKRFDGFGLSVFLFAYLLFVFLLHGRAVEITIGWKDKL